MGRLELANGYVSLDARADGLMTLSVVSALHFDVASGVFSPRTTNAWLSLVESLTDSTRKTTSIIGVTPDLIAATADAHMRVNFELTASPAVSAVHFQRADKVEIAVAGTPNDSSMARLLDMLRRGSARTLALTRASRDSARASMSDMELTDRVPLADVVVKPGRTPWRAADRMFVTFAAAALSGVGTSYASHIATECPSVVGYCRWRIANNGFTTGSIIGASVAGLAFAARGKCSSTKRLGLTVLGSAVAAIPGAYLTRRDKQTAVGVTPLLQTLALETLMRRCR